MITRHRTTTLFSLASLVALAACASKGATTTPALTTGAAPAATPASAPAGATPATSPSAVATPADSATMATVMRATAPQTSSRGDRSLLSREDILSTQYTNLYDVVRTLRGNWLRVRTADSFGKSSQVQVYLDMQHLVAGVEELRTMSPTNILSIRFLDPIQASARWGMDHGAGAIFILTKKQ